MKHHRPAVMAALAALQALSCGDDPPSCPTDDCSVQSRTLVKWKLNHYPERGFDSDTCFDMGTNTMRVELVLVEDPTVVVTQEVECNQLQATFLALAPGTYDVYLTPLDAGAGSIVHQPVKAQVVAGTTEAPAEVLVPIPFEAWTQQYTGTFIFRLLWGGMSCEMATPPVATQTLTLTINGVVSTKMTDKGQKLDGTDPQPCRRLDEEFSQFISGLPMGLATLGVVGKDAAGEVAFEHEFATFVGATENNPPMRFDAPAPVPPDAGVDAGVDASVDAPVDAVMLD